MYMPVLNGYGGSDVTTRVTIFNWRDEHDADGTATPSVRADLLALDGTRLAVWESAIPPRGSAVLAVHTLFEQAGRSDGAAVVKLVVDASTLASLRPYFHYVSRGGVTTTHEKAGGRNPDDIPARWYHWVFPMGESRIEDDPYVFLLNTQTAPMTGQELHLGGRGRLACSAGRCPRSSSTSRCSCRCARRCRRPRAGVRARSGCRRPCTRWPAT